MSDWNSIMEAVKANSTNRVLILSLGTGNIRNKDAMTAKQAYEAGNEDSVYRSANYQIIGDQEIINSCFVAEPLIKKIQPGTIIILGTVKSAWSEIYKIYYNGKKKKCDEASFVRLFEKEQQYGIDTTLDEIDDFQIEINALFEKDRVFHGICSGVKVRIIITQYGINEDELAETYARVSSIREYLKEDKINQVSFDITHSFRSMPLYNLIVLNYINNLKSIDVEIEHIYYGNLEISSEYIREGKSIAAISDLNELSKVLKLTNAVSEFKNTGNANMVINLLPADTVRRKKIRECLQQFDWSTQINDLKTMEVSLRNLLKSINEELNVKQKRSEKYLDIYRMIFDILSENFPSLDDFDGMKNLKENPALYGKIQTRLGKWFLKTNRYGQAVLVATESVRSYFTPVYLISQNKEISRVACEKSQNRDGGEGILLSFFEKGFVDRSLKMIAIKFSDMKRIRNVYAHNLSDKEEYKVGNNEIQELIENYYDKLEDFGKEMESKWEQIQRYYADPFLQSSHEFRITGVTNTHKSFRGQLENGEAAVIKAEEIQEIYGIKTYQEYSEIKCRVRITGYNKAQNIYEVSVIKE